MLQIGLPGACRRYPRPSATLSYIDISGMSEAEQQGLSNSDALLAPNRTNETLYRQHFERVYLCQPGITEKFFRPYPRYRAEGAPKPSFIFVGSFSYRKGVDLLLEAVAEAFPACEARLSLHLPGGAADRAANYIFQMIARIGRPMDVSLLSKNVSGAWMCRLYNRHDACTSMTRGEGWGLPNVEAMLCGLPVIAPFSTGMKDYLDPSVKHLVPTRRVELASITDPFGVSFANGHAGPGISLEEPDVATAVAHLRAVAADIPGQAAMGQRARKHILENFSEVRFVDSVAKALHDLSMTYPKGRSQRPAPDAPPPPVEALPASTTVVAAAAIPPGPKLEIGAGTKPMAGYIHHDIRPLDDIEVICDARAFPAEHKGRYCEVYAANIIEHFNRFEVKKFCRNGSACCNPSASSSSSLRTAARSPGSLRTSSSPSNGSAISFMAARTMSSTSTATLSTPTAWRKC